MNGVALRCLKCRRTRFSSCGNPPAARTTPCRAAIQISRPAFSTTAPAMRPSACASLIALADDHSLIWRSNAVLSRRAASALPFTSRVPRPCRSTSRPWARTREATNRADVKERVGVEEVLQVGAAVQPHPHERGFFSSAGQGYPDDRPVHGRQRAGNELIVPLPRRPAVGMIIRIALAERNSTAVFAARNPTIGPAFSRKAATRAFVEMIPA